jgi:pantetheine-phosphate adenylyltransferase
MSDNLRIAVFPGSFDPVTVGHEHIARRAASMYDKLIVAIGRNSEKNSMFSLEQRQKWIEHCLSDLTNVEVQSYDGLTVDFCEQVGAKYMVRGLRNGVDFEYEQTIAQMSHELKPGIETVVLFTHPRFSAINARVVRDIIKNNGDVSAFIPSSVDVYEK